MDKEILNKFLSEMLLFLQGAKDFTLQQLPLVAKEILHYCLAMSIVYCVLGLGLLGAAWQGHRLIQKAHAERSGKYDSDDVYFFYFLVALIVIPAGFVFFVSLQDFIQILTAPRVFLLEYVSRLLNPSK